MALVGRNPVNLDIFTQTRQDGTDSQARQYNGTSWVAVALQVNGSIVASGTIAGDRLVAGIEISAPVINGGTINGVDGNFTGTIYAKNITGDVVELYGLEVATVTFKNNSKRERIATFTIAAAPFARNLVINPLQFFLGGQSALRLEVYFGSSIGGEPIQGQLIKNNHKVSSLYRNEVYVSSKPFYVDVTAGVPLTLTLALTDIGNPSGYQAIGGTTSGKTSLTLARSGASFSRSFP